MLDFLIQALVEVTVGLDPQEKVVVLKVGVSPERNTVVLSDVGLAEEDHQLAGGASGHLSDTVLILER